MECKFDKKIFELFVRRLRMIPCTGGNVDVRRKSVVLGELLSLGYEAKNHEAYDDSMLEHFQLVVDALIKLKAGHVDYVPLFMNFPTEIPDDDEHLAKRLIGLVGNSVGFFEEGFGSVKLDSRVIVPSWLFDLEQFGADPLTQFQDKNLFDRGKANQEARKSDESVSLTPIKFAGSEEAYNTGLVFLKNTLQAKSSIKETLKEDVELLLAFYEQSGLSMAELEPEKISFKETKAYLMKFFWERQNYEAVADLVSAPTDMLRLFAALTDSDITLSEKIKFPKLVRSQRRWVCETLNKFDNLSQDLVRYRGLWLAVGKSVHVGDWKKAAPETYKAFDELRNGTIKTWSSTLEQTLNSNRPVLKDVLHLLGQRPGEFARRLHHVLRLFPRSHARIVKAFAEVSDQLPAKNLFLLNSYFAAFDAAKPRAIINKKGKIKILPNSLPALSDKTKNRLKGTIEASLAASLEKKSVWGNYDDSGDFVASKVWIDPQLKKFVAPFAQRSASEAFLAAGRGTRLKLDPTKVLRLFTYWKEEKTRTDLDLSLVEFDKDMNYVGHVSYTRLSSDGIVHSGDITSAPHGAAEFIDVNLATLKKKGVRYIAPQVYRYTGDSFADMAECYVGWMGREKVDQSYKSFDIKTVENAFTLNGNTAYALPIVVDLKTNEVIYTDLYIGSYSSLHRVENSLNSVSAVAREVARFVDTKPNVYDLAKQNADARKAILVDTQEEADYTIGVSDCDLNATETEKILTELI